MAGKFSKAPPVLKEGVSYRKWLHELEAWQLLTDTEVKKQAVQIYLYGLEGQYKDLISKVAITELNRDNGVKTITDKLDLFIKEDESQRAFSTYERMHSYRRKDHQSVSEALIEFDAMASDFTAMKMILPAEVMAFHVLKSMNLPTNLEKLAKATVDTLDYKTMVAKIKSLAVDDSVCSEEGAGALKLEVKEESDVLYTRGGPRYNRGRGRGTQRGRGSIRSDRTQWRCYKCDSPNHLSYDCPEQRNDGKSSDLRCYKCNQIGHFAKACPKNKSEPGGCHITLLQSNVGISEFLGETLGHAVIDSACKHSLTGSVWLDEYLKTLTDQERREVREESCSMSFRFGDGVEVKSKVKVTIPVNFGGTKCNLETAVIDNELPLLLSIQSMKKGKVKLNFEDGTMELLGNVCKMKTTSSGHLIVPLSEKGADEESNVVLHINNLSKLSKSVKLSKMKKLHVQFSHASKEALWRLLVASGIRDKSLQEALLEVTTNCDICKKYRRKPLRPCVAEPLAHDFNTMVAMDLKTVEKDKIYILHLICLGTKYSQAGVVRSKHQDVIIRKVLELWIRNFGSPRTFMTDNGREFSNESFRELCQQFNIVSTTTPGESPWSNGVVERHNAILMETVNRTMSETKCNLETAVAWAVSVKNTMSNVSGYSPNVLVFGRNPNFPSVLSDDLPALESCTLSEIVRRNSNALHCAKKAYIAADSSERIRRALRMKVRVSNNLIVRNGESVYYRREKYKGWLGPGTVVGRDNKLVLVRHGGECYRVPLCHVLPVKEAQKVCNDQSTGNVRLAEGSNQSRDDDIFSEAEESRQEHEEDDAEEEGQNSFAQVESDGDAENIESDDDTHAVDELNDQTVELTGNVLPQVNTKVKFLSDDEEGWKTASILGHGGTRRGRNKYYMNIKVVGEEKPRGVFWDRHVSLWKLVTDDENVVLMTDSEELKDVVVQAKQTELNSWDRNHVYERVIDEGQKAVSSRWVITKKDDGRIKARLVCRGYEEDVSSLRTDSPTCTKESMRLVYVLGASYRWPVQSLDVRSAFLQGFEINREVHMRPPKDVEDRGYIWKLRRCPYGLNDAPRNWYQRVKMELFKLGVQLSRYDEALFYYKCNGSLEGILALHVDDFVYSGSLKFCKEVIDRLVGIFDVRVQQCGNFKYIGLDLVQVGSEVHLNQNVYVQSLQGVTMSEGRSRQVHESLTSDEKLALRSVCGQLLWIANNTRPDLCFETCQLCNLGKSAVVGDLLKLNKLVRRAKQENVSVKFPNLSDPNKWIVTVYCDASYANLPDGSSQGGFIVFITSSEEKAAPMVWQSRKLQRITRSTLSSETLSMVEAVDAGFLLVKQIEEVLGVQPPMIVYTDNQSLHQTVHTSHVLTDKSIRVNIGFLRQLVNNGEIEVRWISTGNQLADALTKQGSSSAELLKVLRAAHL